jgi:hypothetical protein
LRTCYDGIQPDPQRRVTWPRRAQKERKFVLFCATRNEVRSANIAPCRSRLAQYSEFCTKSMGPPARRTILNRCPHTELAIFSAPTPFAKPREPRVPRYFAPTATNPRAEFVSETWTHQTRRNVDTASASPLPLPPSAFPLRPAAFSTPHSTGLSARQTNSRLMPTEISPSQLPPLALRTIECVLPSALNPATVVRTTSLTRAHATEEAPAGHLRGRRW